jgi:hypothetical protein
MLEQHRNRPVAQDKAAFAVAAVVMARGDRGANHPHTPRKARADRVGHGLDPERRSAKSSASGSADLPQSTMINDGVETCHVLFAGQRLGRGKQAHS